MCRQGTADQHLSSGRPQHIQVTPGNPLHCTRSSNCSQFSGGEEMAWTAPAAAGAATWAANESGLWSCSAELLRQGCS